jgi:hypothetical protein
LEKIALPTPGFSDAPITAIEDGERKMFFKFSLLNKKVISSGYKNIKKFSFYIKEIFIIFAKCLQTS